MWQLSQAIDGITEACRALSIPVVGGNVSLYNESSGIDIDPTPVVAIAGLIDELERKPPSLVWEEGDTIVLLGDPVLSLAGSRWASERGGRRGGRLLPVDWNAHLALMGLVHGLVAAESSPRTASGLVSAVHDVSSGGIAVALAECALASGIGARIEGTFGPVQLFSETPSRALVATRGPQSLRDAAKSVGVPTRELGAVGGGRFVVGPAIDLDIVELAQASRRIARSLSPEAAI